MFHIYKFLYLCAPKAEKKTNVIYEGNFFRLEIHARTYSMHAKQTYSGFALLFFFVIGNEIASLSVAGTKLMEEWIFVTRGSEINLREFIP